MGRSAHRRVRWKMIALVWGVATLLGLLVAATTRIGPILVVVVRNHGLHLGDAVTFLVCYLIAAAITLWIVRSARFPRPDDRTR